MSLNLLPSEAKFQTAKIKQKMLVNKIMIWVGGVWLFVLVVVFGLGFLAQIRQKNVMSQYEKAQGNYASMTDDIRVNQQLKYQAKLVGKTLTNRFEYGKSFETIQQLFPEAFTITSYDLQQEGVFEVSGYTSGKPNVDKLERIVDDTNNGSSTILQKAKMTALTYKNSYWIFSMEVALP